MSSVTSGTFSAGCFSVGQHVWAKFSHEKNFDAVSDYRAACAKACGFDWSRCRIDSILKLAASEYDALATSLLQRRPEFAGQGGTDSGDPQPPFRDKPQLMSTLWEPQLPMFLKVILVQAPEREIILLDPQLCDYVRHVGLDIRTEPPEVRDPGNCLGRWVRDSIRGTLAVICHSRAYKSGIRNVLLAVALDRTEAPYCEIRVPLPEDCFGNWEWAFSNSDHEKLTAGQVAALREQARQRQEAMLARHQAEQALLEEQFARTEAEFQRRKPDCALAVIVAGLMHPNEDFRSCGKRYVFLAWSRHLRFHAAELRKAAAAYGPTAHLATGPEEYVHRKKWGRYSSLWLEDASTGGKRWKVQKIPCATARTYELEWAAPEPLPTASAASPKS